MSKSLGNHVGIDEAPEEMFGKLMSVSDDLMRRYAQLLCASPEDILDPLDGGSLHPMEAKKQLAAELVGRYHGPDGAAQAAEFFNQRFQRREDHEPTVFEVTADDGEIWIAHLLKQIGFAPSSTAARKLAEQGAVRVDGEVVGPDFRFKQGAHRLVAVGRRKLAEIRFS